MSPGTALIIGGGPAGMACALYLARAGCRVTLVEARQGPSTKVCGEGLMPAGVPVLDDLGVLGRALSRGARPFRGIRYRSRSGRTACGEFPRWRSGVRGLAMPRAVLDAVLAEQIARTPGIEVRSGWVVGAPLTDGERVRGVRARARDTGAEACLEADLTIGADGLHSRLHALPGVLVERPRRRRFGIGAHFEGVSGLEDMVEVHLLDGGEFYVTPEGPDRASLALVVEEELLGVSRAPDTLMRALIARAPELSRRLAHARFTDTPRLLGPLGMVVSRTAGPGWMLTGDAAGALDPITGEGVALALLTAQALGAQVRARGALDLAACQAALHHRQRIERELRLLTGALLFLTRSEHLAEAALWTVGRLPGIFSRLLGIAAACPHPSPLLSEESRRSFT